MTWSQKLDRVRTDHRGLGGGAQQRRIEQEASAASGALMQSAAGTFVMTSSRATYQAAEPMADHTLLEVDSRHAFTVVMTATSTARGHSYLNRNLTREVQTQAQKADGDMAQAFLAAISALDTAFRRIHPFNGPVLEGVRIAAAYIDASTNTVHLASNGGGAICAVGRRQPDGSCTVAATIGAFNAASSEPADCIVQKLRLDQSIDTVLVASPGLWRELSAQHALLRLSHYHGTVPAANGGNAAAHLTNLALHAVTRRLRSSADPRMRSLREVHHLNSLWVGDRSNYKGASRQPLRRRRGDVHGDLSAAVLQLQWEGQDEVMSPAGQEACKLRHSQSATTVSCYTQRPNATARWAHLRMHFLTFPRAARQQTILRWRSLVNAALEQTKVAGNESVAKLNKRPTEIHVRASSRDLDSVGVVSVSA